MEIHDDVQEAPAFRFRLVAESWQEIDLLGKPVRLGRDADERPRRWLITTITSDGSHVIPFRGTEAEAHARARLLGSDRYTLVPRFGI